MKEYLNIRRNPIFVTMKTLLFFLPIGIITNRICEIYLGELRFSLDSILGHETVIVVSVFCALSLLIHFIESVILPMVLVFIDSKTKIDKSFKRSIVSTDKILIFLKGRNPYKEITKLENKQLFRANIAQEITYLCSILILWLIVENTFLSYVSIIFVFILTFYLYKVFNSFFSYYKENELNRPS